MPISTEAQEVLDYYAQKHIKDTYRDPALFQAKVAERRAVQEKGKPYLLPEFVREHVDVINTITWTAKMQYFLLTPKGGVTSDMKIMYVHGGGFWQEINRGQWNWAIRLCTHFGCKVYVPIYATGPLYGYQQTYNGLMDLYRMLREQRRWNSLVLAGDSCGGTFCQAISCFAQQQELPQPGAILYYFGNFDTRLTNPEMRRIAAEIDPVIDVVCDPMEVWAPGADLESFPPNPWFGPHEKHPPFLSIAAGNDMLKVTAHAFCQEADKLQIPYEFYEYPDMFHCFMMWTIPETQDLLERTERFLRTCGVYTGKKGEQPFVSQEEAEAEVLGNRSGALLDSPSAPLDRSDTPGVRPDTLVDCSGASLDSSSAPLNRSDTLVGRLAHYEQDMGDLPGTPVQPAPRQGFWRRLLARIARFLRGGQD